jgi:predicted DNA-binding transcriptional regulator AlpA
VHDLLYNVKQIREDVAVPKNPEHEGSPRLMTTTEIAAEHGVSRQTIHTYRRTGIFPSPVEGGGSTRPRFREDEVAAFFKANPKQPRKKRRFPSELGAAVTTTTARDRLTETLTSPGLVGLDAEHAAELVDAYRAAVLREAADKLDESETLRDLTDDHMSDVNAAANELRRMADEQESATNE